MKKYFEYECGRCGMISQPMFHCEGFDAWADEHKKGTEQKKFDCINIRMEELPHVHRQHS